MWNQHVSPGRGWRGVRVSRGQRRASKRERAILPPSVFEFMRAFLWLSPHRPCDAVLLHLWCVFSHLFTASADVLIVNTAHFQVPTEAHILIMLYTDQNIAIDLHSYLHNMKKHAHLLLLLYYRYQLKLTGEKMWCLTFLQN